jgi:hypothetical protein
MVLHVYVLEVPAFDTTVLLLYLYSGSVLFGCGEEYLLSEYALVNPLMNMNVPVCSLSLCHMCVFCEL